VLPFAGADLDVQQFDAMGARFNDLKLRMREMPQGWSFDLDSPQLAGAATWSPPGPALPNGRVLARLSRITMPGRGSPATWQSAEAKGAAADSQDAPSNHWPEIDLAADAFYSKERNLGKLEFVAKPQGADWKIDKLVLANEGGRLEANGAWKVAAERSRRSSMSCWTRRIPPPSSRATAMPKGVKGAATRIDGQVGWAGAPHEFDYGSLNGTFRIRVGPAASPSSSRGRQALGRAVAAGAPAARDARLQRCLQRRIAFDEITGSVRLPRRDEHVRLEARRAGRQRSISPARPISRRRRSTWCTVQPALSSIVSSGAALLFLTNPLVGAVVGAGSLFAQAILQDPVEKMFRYEYTITGGWSRSCHCERQRQCDASAGVWLRYPVRRAIDDEHSGMMRVAAVQTVSAGDVDANSRECEPLVAAAAAEGARSSC
jgi:uncharacterized protein YhdP